MQITYRIKEAPKITYFGWFPAEIMAAIIDIIFHNPTYIFVLGRVAAIDFELVDHHSYIAACLSHGQLSMLYGRITMPQPSLTRPHLSNIAMPSLNLVRICDEEMINANDFCHLQACYKFKDDIVCKMHDYLLNYSATNNAIINMHKRNFTLVFNNFFRKFLSENPDIYQKLIFKLFLTAVYKLKPVYHDNTYNDNHYIGPILQEFRTFVIKYLPIILFSDVRMEANPSLVCTSRETIACFIEIEIYILVCANYDLQRIAYKDLRRKLFSPKYLDEAGKCIKEVVTFEGFPESIRQHLISELNIIADYKDD